MSHISILGAGISGLAAAQYAHDNGYQVTLYEKEKEKGGHTRTHNISGYLFDEGPHFSFTKERAIQSLFEDAVNQDYLEIPLVIKNYWQGHWLSHPVQCHLHGLPDGLIQACISDFEKRHEYQASTAQNYEAWCYQHFGKTLSEQFIFQYTKKYWTVSPQTLSVDWTKPRIYVPTLEDIVKGSKENTPSNFHYIKTIRYPRLGGFASYTNFFTQENTIQYSHRLMNIDVTKKTLTFENGYHTSYKQCVSTLPLPEIVKLIENVPQTLTQAASKLKHTSVLLCCIGFDKWMSLPEGHLQYFYDEEIIFSRAYYPHLLSPHTVPEGTSSVQCEIYHAPGIDYNHKKVLNRTIDDLIKVGALQNKQHIAISKVIPIPYANVIMTPDRAQHVKTIHDFLKAHDIVCSGRYGEWDYYWTDDSILSGQRAVKQLMD